MKNKRELLEHVGEKRFIEECKKVILKYHRLWLEADSRLGIFINQEEAYWTYLDNYIEREWQILKRAWDQNLLEEGYYVVAYCPGCQTSLSSAEVGYEGSYKEVEDPSLYFKFKITGVYRDGYPVGRPPGFSLVIKEHDGRGKPYRLLFIKHFPANAVKGGSAITPPIPWVFTAIGRSVIVVEGKQETTVT